MSKYAYTFKPHRELTAFVGPFDSYEQMRKDLTFLANDDDTGTDDLINDMLFIEHNMEYLRNLLNIHIYCVDEMAFTNKDFIGVCDDWRMIIEEKNKRYKIQSEQHERELYERLKKKFEEEE